MKYRLCILAGESADQKLEVAILDLPPGSTIEPILEITAEEVPAPPKEKAP